jgi:7-cyano-7-deazaguanine synthase in queuosine biosynthesis
MAAVEVDFTGDGQGRRVAWQRHFWIDDGRISSGLQEQLPARLADLIDLAMAVYVADRITRRGSEAEADADGQVWRRSFRLTVGVRDHSFWSRPSVSERLDDLLDWLTDDQWDLHLMPRRMEPRVSELQQYLLSGQHQGPQAVAMFSGGADSLAGALQLIHEHPRRPLTLVSASSNLRLGSVQRDLVTQLRARNAEVRWIRVPFALTRETVPDSHERSQRTRGFVFLALGACVAALARASRLFMFENGIGAINLPYLEVQFGAQSSRTAHPKTHRIAEALIAEVLSAPLEIANPYLFFTKGQVCADVADEDAGLLGMTESCDGFPLRVKGKTRCGRCTSCVLRVQALAAAGRSNVERFDLYQHPPFGEPRSKGLAVSLLQVDRIWRCLASDDPWRALAGAFPMLAELPGAVVAGPGDLFQGLVQQRTVHLLRRYVEEWTDLVCGSAAHRMEACG